VICSATDSAGNTGTGGFTVTVRDGSPGGFGKLAPADEASGLPLSLILSWGESGGATSYEYCVDTSNDSACDYAWIPVGDATSAGLGPLDFDTTFYWQVRAINGSGTTQADAGAWWQFRTGGPTLLEMSFRSLGTYDGWVLEQDETSGKGGTFNATATTGRLGDDGLDRQYRSILDFDTSTLPDDAVVVGVTIRVKRQGIDGTNRSPLMGC
jgi:hypothetical protein